MDKQQIIINGVNVSGCEYVCNTAFGNIGCKLPFNEEIHCCNNLNCYYKQLARKTQECEELKERLVRTEEDLKYQCVDCMNVKSDRYRKAIDEIKEIVKDWYKNEWSCYMCRKNMDKKLEDILDIINKVKDGK